MKAKEIIAVVKAMCNMQQDLDTAHARIDKLVINNQQTDGMLKVNKAEIDVLRDERNAVLLKYDKLEQLHTAAITGFKSDTELLQAELDAAKEETRSAQQEVVYLKNALDGALSSLSCVTVDAVAHCNGEHAESLRTFINLVKEHVVLSIQNRVDLDAMIAALDHDF